MRFICLVYLRFGDGGRSLVFFTPVGGETIGNIFLREKMEFVYGIDCSFGGFIYVAGGGVFDIEEML
jgi:hypothetical protein